MKHRERLDRQLVDRGLVESRTRAQALIMAGHVSVGGRKVDKPGTMVDRESAIEIKGQDHPYVSRGGLKLAGALSAFEFDPSNRIAMDIGASTGGFTDCLLQHGAKRVHAVDVGYGQLAWKLVSDERVVVHDRQNIRKLSPEQIGESVDLVVADCSFIALAKVLPHVPRFLAPKADVIALIKPQFELEPGRVGKGGIVRDESDRADAVGRVEDTGRELGFEAVAKCPSPITGREGNVEFLIWLRWGGQAQPADSLA